MPEPRVLTPDPPSQVTIRFPSGRVETVDLVATSDRGDLFVRLPSGEARWVPADWRVAG